MTGVDMLYRLHCRLQEIMDLNGEDTRFGNITIIAVGDLYQLLRVMDKKIFNRPGNIRNPDLAMLHESLWQENFAFHELTTVVRQSDKSFAETLNQLQIGMVTDSDDELLRRVIQPDDPKRFMDALHVYRTNKEANNYNSSKMDYLKVVEGKTAYKAICEDTRLYRGTGQVRVEFGNASRRKTGGLEHELELAEGAAVKLMTNIDAADGLAN